MFEVFENIGQKHIVKAIRSKRQTVTICLSHGTISKRSELRGCQFGTRDLGIYSYNHLAKRADEAHQISVSAPDIHGALWPPQSFEQNLISRFERGIIHAGVSVALDPVVCSHLVIFVER